MAKTVKRLKQDNSGMTMVEVLMGFLILSIILGGVVTMITFSSNMYFRSVDERRDQTAMMEEAYKSSVSGASAGTNCVIYTGLDGSGSSINLQHVLRYEMPKNTYIFSYKE